MTNTTKAWLLRYPIVGYCIIAALIFIGAYQVNNSHWAEILQAKEDGTLVAYFWIVIFPILVAMVRDSTGGILFATLSILIAKVLIIVCFFLDSTTDILSYIVLAIDAVATIWWIVLGVKIGKWTYANMDEVIPRRAKWRDSKVDIYSMSLNYSISRGVACAFSGYSCIALFLLFIIIR